MKKLSERELYTILNRDKEIVLEEDICITKHVSQRKKERFFETNEPINMFEGTLDGKGYCIKNPPIRLFKKITQDSTIKNISIKFTENSDFEDSDSILCWKNEGILKI